MMVRRIIPGSRLKRLLCLLLLGFCSLSAVVSEQVDENSRTISCTASGDADKEESCTNPEEERVCGVTGRCGSSVDSGSIYSLGGSAQAYKPHTPLKDFVCDPSSSSGKRKQPRVATWPFSRGRQRGESPTLHVQGSLWTCSTENDQCCCNLLKTETEELAVVEVWQAHPDGTYSAISSDENVDCRATVPMKGSLFEFDTLLPGSTGIFNGLGPFGWDNSPYGPPVIHFLINTPEHKPLLVDIPVLTDRSMQPSSFWGPDLRGQSLSSRKRQSDTAYKVSSWVMEGNEIQLGIDFFLEKAEGKLSTEQALCPSSVYGFPSSFFFEPISVCAPTILDFFKL